ncbi:serine/threonine-protein kinase [Streptomyces sp. NPDC058045]|uniref:serine/threonine-protein kinase n=1 Tax=Streptomyces sp. NPDC058045 TaxID=3346311 RepID=UPI0036E31802
MSGEYGQSGDTGRLLAGRYRVIARLGRGGMGIVWRARDEALAREVAVKELRTFSDAAAPELADLRLRMQREARAAARVRHPGVVAVYDIAEEDGRPLIVMELVDGPSLDDVLNERGTLDPLEAAALGAEVLDALAAAHRAGVLHRDVKPGNILLERGGRVVLTDFGIAAMEDPGDGAGTHLTRSGELVGSLDYLAPERAQGHTPGPASDVWALGATLYAAVEGNSPFRRTSTWSTLTAIVVEPLPEPRRAGPLTGVLRQLMAKDPGTRPDAAAAAELLRAVAAGEDGDVPTTALRTTAPAPHDATAPTTPLPPPPPGFGPPQDPGAETWAAQPVPVPLPVPVPQPITAPAAVPGQDAPASRRRGRVLLAVAAVIAVLAAAGTAVALLGDRDDKPTVAATAPPDSPGASRGTLDGTRESDAPSPSPHPTRGHPSTGSSEGGGTPDPDRTHDKPDQPTRSATHHPTPTRTGGSDPEPPAACHAIGGGKYNCEVWRRAASYTASGTKVGTLNSGTNYFFCQQNLGRRETSGQWTNVWWAKTDDDSGNSGVYVNVVNVRGGRNDAPVPGLPTC